MKTRTWILLLTALFIFSGILGFFLLRPGNISLYAEIYSHGNLIRRVSLAAEQEFTVSVPGGGSNTVKVESGKIGVIAATCPDHYCVHRGFCSSGAPIICLPNRLEIRFVADAGPDFSIG